MLRIAFVFLIFLHGLIHFLGFIKSFEFADLKELTLPIAKPFGLLWLLVGILFLITGISYLIRSNHWWLLGLIALVLSQIIIFSFWKDAKFGTIANVIILIVSLIGFGDWNFENHFKKDIQNGFVNATLNEVKIISPNDLTHLPPIVQEYLNYVGIVGKPEVKNVSILFAGEMRSRSGAWFSFTSEQFNFFDAPKRLFFMKAKVKGFPTNGYHAYQDGKASMQVKLLSLFPVVSEKGDLLDQAEMVTFFNDLCLFAPARLIDENITWEVLSNTSVKAFFRSNGRQISAVLKFNEQGQLLNFISEDRSDVSDGKNYTFSTPVGAYKNINGFNVCTYGEAIWHYPEGKFTYGKFNLKRIDYNVNQ
ncbi:MAG: hypothetical protein Sapg2KO_39670 [Saprospiraceae bacterium]